MDMSTALQAPYLRTFGMYKYGNHLTPGFTEVRSYTAFFTSFLAEGLRVRFRAIRPVLPEALLAVFQELPPPPLRFRRHNPNLPAHLADVLAPQQPQHHPGLAWLVVVESVSVPSAVPAAGSGARVFDAVAGDRRRVIPARVSPTAT